MSISLPLPSATEISNIANRAEDAINRSGSRIADTRIIEGAIREALMLVVGRLNIQVQAGITLDLNK